MWKHIESTACTILQEVNLPCNSHSEGRLLWTAKEYSEVSFQYVLKYLSKTLMFYVVENSWFWFL